MLTDIVINYDMTDSADAYLHRIIVTLPYYLWLVLLSLANIFTSTGCSGTTGLSVTFVSSDSDVLNQVCITDIFNFLTIWYDQQSAD
jgi:hypothetical protein